MKLVLVVKDKEDPGTKRDLATLDRKILQGYEVVVEDEMLIGQPGIDRG